MYPWTYRDIFSSIHSPEAYAVLTLLAEILGAKSLPGAPELVIALLDTLSKVISDSSVTTADKTYVEQLLLSALENAVGSVSVRHQPDPVESARLTFLTGWGRKVSQDHPS